MRLFNQKRNDAICVAVEHRFSDTYDTSSWEENRSGKRYKRDKKGKEKFIFGSRRQFGRYSGCTVSEISNEWASEPRDGSTSDSRDRKTKSGKYLRLTRIRPTNTSFRRALDYHEYFLDESSIRYISDVWCQNLRCRLSSTYT